MTTPDTGVLLLQLGGPSSLAEVRPFIYRMLCDPAVVSLPKVLRVPLAAMISALRARKVRGQYEAIGGRSPITEITKRQGALLEEVLLQSGLNMPVLIGQRHSPPFINEALREAKGMGLRRLLVLPLFPQYSKTTTGSAFEEVRRHGEGMDLWFIYDYADHPRYISALSETVLDALSKVSLKGRKACRVLFSAHGLPLRYVEKGDPYPQQVAKTVEAVVRHLGGLVEDFAISYQSKVGPIRWLEPSTSMAIRQAGEDGVKALVLVPVAFVSDHIETLYEMDILYRREAEEAHIPEFVRAPALNDSKTFIKALAEIVEARLKTGPLGVVGSL